MSIISKLKKPTNFKVKFIGNNEKLPFTKDHVYDATVDKRKYGFVIISKLDLTENKDVNCYLCVENEDHFWNNFKMMNDEE